MSNLFSTKGRAGRADWWVTTLVGGVVAQVALLGTLWALVESSGGSDLTWVLTVGLLAVAVAALWATVAVTARRFRDRGESPWMTLLLLVPVVGELWVVVVCGLLPNPRGHRRKSVVRTVRNRPDAGKREPGRP